MQNDAELVITDAAHDGRVRDSRAPAVLSVAAYLGVPLRAPGGEPIGALCAIDDKPRQWTPAERATLHELAEAVSATIALRVSEHRRSVLATEASHELRSPLTALRFELDELSHLGGPASAALETAVGHVDDLTATVEELVSVARTGPLCEHDVNLYALCVASCPRGDVSVDGDDVVVVSTSQPVLQHVLRLLVAAVAGRASLHVGADDVIAWIEVRADHTSHVDLCAVRTLLNHIGGRLLVAPSPGVFEIVVARGR